MDSLVEDLPDDKATTLREKLIADVDKPASHVLPKNSRAIIESYTKKQAEEWIAEYEEAMAETQEEDS